MANDEGTPKGTRTAAEDAEAPENAEAPEHAEAPENAEDDGDRRPDDKGAPWVVGIGASAGGLEALTLMLGEIPADAQAAFVVVVHLDPDRESLLAELLAARTALTVVAAADGDVATAGRVHVIEPGTELTLVNGRLRAVTTADTDKRRAPIDAFFRSLAADRGHRAICVVLSGAGSEGALGLQAVKEGGGLTLVQEPETAAYESMPRAAAATGLVDHVVEVPQMWAICRAHIQRSGARPALLASQPEAETFLRAVAAVLRAATGHDFAHYKPNTLLRRIDRRMAVLQVTDFDGYLHRLRANPTEVTRLFRELLIGVTASFATRLRSTRWRRCCARRWRTAPPTGRCGCGCRPARPVRKPTRSRSCCAKRPESCGRTASSRSSRPTSTPRPSTARASASSRLRSRRTYPSSASPATSGPATAAIKSSAASATSSCSPSRT